MNNCWNFEVSGRSFDAKSVGKLQGSAHILTPYDIFLAFWTAIGMKEFDIQ